MRDPAQLIVDVRARGGQLRVRDGKLELRDSGRRVPAPLREALRDNAAAVIAHLNTPPAPPLSEPLTDLRRGWPRTWTEDQ